MALTKQVEKIIKRFSSWDEFFFLTPPWNANEDTQKILFQSFYNFIVLRTNISNFSLEEVNELIDYLQSTRIEDYKFLTNLTNPYSPRSPSDEWFDEKAEGIKNTMGKNLELKILRGAAHAQKYEGGGSMIAFRPYDFSVFARE